MIRIALATAIAAMVFGGAGTASLMVSPEHRVAQIAAAPAQVSLTLVERRGGLTEVVARITPAGAEPRTITLQMYDGEEVTVALPGRAGTHYHFRRVGRQVTAEIRI